MYTFKHASFLLVFFVLSLVSCTPQYEETIVNLKSYVVEDGFVLQAVAAEPLIEAPVDMSIDNQGRIWVVEMRGYMRNIEGISEDEPVGRIVILEDRDKDGQADHVKTFLDSLVLPRGIVHVYGGLLYAEPPNLWFVEINDDLTAGKKQLVDDAYAVGGNVEHQPNGLLLNIDNWIYNAKSNKRYRYRDGEWLVEFTEFRGQWGITHDPYGRLLYNDNSTQLRGDWALPNMLSNNPGFRPRMSSGFPVVRNQNVYPLTATAINRGYTRGALDEDGKVRRFTSACGPLIYAGSMFPDEYNNNAFVCGPEVNLIKRNIINFDQLRISGEQATEGSEFIASTDESFRPVNLKNAPDGSMYVVDMHRGIIQHKTYMTSYLREQYLDRGLDSIIGMGRILRVVSHGDTLPPKSFDLTAWTTSQLIDSLSSRNVWVRDRAQALLIDRKESKVGERIEQLVESASDEVTRIHALYVLEGLGLLEPRHVRIANKQAFPFLIAHCIRLSADNMWPLSTAEIDELRSMNSELIDYFMAYYFGRNPSDENIAYLTSLITRYNEENWFLEAIQGSYSGTVEQFEAAAPEFTKTRDLLQTALTAPPQQISAEIGQDQLTRGLLLFREHCAVCHGPDGRGMDGLAPPLLQSDYVAGDPRRLASILLYGLDGPVNVNGQLYELPAAMPGLKANDQLTNDHLGDIINYIRNAFATSTRNIRIEQIDSLRTMNRPSTAMYSEAELKEIYN